MKTSGNTILITGGSSGIGLALAEAFLKHNNTVLICGRREEALQEAKKKHPQLHTRVCDIADENERRLLFEWATDSFPDLNILVNNAGIQRMIDVKKGIAALDGEDEIEINLKALVDLSLRFTPFLEKKESAIMNVSSGLAFAPLAIAPIYCATKAAVHSFTLSLRHQLKNTKVKVFEIIPPRVATALGTKDRQEIPDGIPASEVASAVLDAMQHDRYEIAVGMAEGLRANPQAAFERMNH